MVELCREGKYDKPANKEIGKWQNRDGYKNYCSGVYVAPGNIDRASASSSESKLKDMMAKVLQKYESTKAQVKEMRGALSSMSKMVDSHTTSIRKLNSTWGNFLN